MAGPANMPMKERPIGIPRKAIAVARLLLHRIGHQGEGHELMAPALNQTGGNESEDGGGDGGEDRPNAVKRQTDEQERFPPEPVGQAAERDLKQGIGQTIGTKGETDQRFGVGKLLPVEREDRKD
jgi:hypothetical protein